MKLLAYWKNTHTDQYLNFSSHHQLHEKQDFINMLLDRCLLSDRQKKVEHITKALDICGYPSWTIKKMKEKQS